MKLKEKYKNIPLPYPMRESELIFLKDLKSNLNSYHELNDKPRFIFYKQINPIINAF